MDLTGYVPNSGTKSVFQKYITLSEDITAINIENIDDDVGFLIIQLHSFIENVTLSYNFTLQAHSFVTGSNIGLIYGYGDSTATFYVFRNVQRNYHIYDPFLLVITVYDALGTIN